MNLSFIDLQGLFVKLFVDDDWWKIFQSLVYEGIKYYLVIDSVISFGKFVLVFLKVKFDFIDERMFNDVYVDLI